MFSFGQSATATQQQPQQQQTQTPTFSFGGASTQQPQQQTQTPTFSFGAASQQQQQQQSAQQQSSLQVQQQRPTTIDRHTRVSDLQQDAQIMIEQLDAHIASQKSISDQLGLSQEAGQQQVDSVELDVQEITRRYGQLKASLTSDSAALERLRDLVREDGEHALLSTRFVDGLRSGTVNLRTSTDAVLKYFYETTDKAELDVKGYARLISQVEEHVRHLRAEGAQVDATLLMGAVTEQQEAFLRLAEVVADLHDRSRR
jgi:nucleoporin p58/p45